MRSIRSHWLVGISAAWLALAVLAPAPLMATKHPHYGGVLRVQLRASNVSLDPREWKPGSLAAADGERLAGLVYDRLVTLDEYGRFQAALATDWTHDSSLRSWQFRIRSGVKFSDGSPLAAKDVAVALQALLPMGLTASNGENSVTVRAQRAIPDLLEQLSSGRFFVFRVQSGGVLLGTGPFVLAESQAAPSADGAAAKATRMRFRASLECWEGRPFLDGIDVTLGDPALRQVLNLQAGRADVVDIPPDLVRKARQENLRVWSSQPDTLLALRFDEAQSSTVDTRVREALDLALDRETMANVLLQRQAAPATALLPQWLSGYAFLFSAPMNLQRAKELRGGLAANIAGGSEPLRLRVDAVGDLMKLLGERVAVNARQANLSIQLVPHGSTAGTSTTPAIGLHLFAWHYDTVSPRAELQALAQYFRSEKVVDLASESNDPEKLFGDEQQMLETRRVLPLVLLPEYVGVASNVRNWSVGPCGEWRLADVWLDTEESAAGVAGERAGEGNAARGVHP